ncbi:hypothetical protein MTR67_050826 [Solanum verrucosum]|uniref:Uncharacterized protein n=1 Tax=Solanum verrucosum TaxID=315347 RepID=A0AAF0V615_SOLVR|nr:hypothetical protein MTR67_050826 [Solanum verrucosum]
MHSPKKSHMDAALRLVRYLKSAPGLGILMSSHGSNELKVLCDADWGACINSRRSITGAQLKLSIELWASIVAEIVWVVGLFQELGVSISQHVSLYSDNTSTLQIATNHVFHERTKHIEIDCHFMRENIQDGLLVTRYIPSADQPADILTKALGVYSHSHLMSKLGMKDIFIAPSLKEGVKELSKCIRADELVNHN